MTSVVRVVTEALESMDGIATTQERRDRFPRVHRALEAVCEPRWANEVVARLTDLLKLEPGWDSYAAPSLSRDAAMFSLEVLQNVMQPATPVPFVVPMSTGGIQFEWHQPFFDLEICISAPYKGQFCWSDSKSGEEGEGIVEQNLTALQAAVRKISG